jgi:pimeloyl-ACP methyl ester carboxylesterase
MIGPATNKASGIAVVISVLMALSSCAPLIPHRAARAVSSLRYISLDGVRQAVLVRGDNRANPILLFLHGGPGVPEMPLSYKNAELERDFIVVHWDQRGAGKSFRPDTPDMRVDQFVRDTLQLTRMLRAEFGQLKIYLVGHSWGSLIGALAVAREPQLFRAYVGISQFVDIPNSERELDRRAREVASQQGNNRALSELKELGPFPYPNHRIERRVNKIQKQIMGEVPHEMSAGHFVSLAAGSPYYSIFDYARMLRGIVFSGKALEHEIYSANLFQSAPEIDVPVYFFEGRRDTVLSPIVAERYFDRLITPRGKHLIWFENSNHWPQFEEPEKYRHAMRMIRQETK